MANQALVEEKLRLARPVIDRYVEDASIDAVCITGSLLAGLGTSYSDVDVFAITAPGCRPAEPTVEHGVGLDRVEVEIRTSEWLKQIKEVTQPYRARIGDDNQIRYLPEGLVADAVRLKIGNVVKQSPELTAVKASLDSGAENLRKMMIARIASDLGDYWMDTLGFLSDGDFESVDVVSHEILETALDGSCVQEGDFYRGDKWIWSRVRRSRNLGTVSPWLRKLFVDNVPEGATSYVPRYAERMLAAQKIIALATLREWYPQTSGDYTLSPARFAETGYIRSPYWILVRMADSAILTDRDVRHYTVPDLAVACWAAADGVPRPVLADSVGAMVPDADRGEIEAIVTNLEKIGAITTKPEWLP